MRLIADGNNRESELAMTARTTLCAGMPIHGVAIGANARANLNKATGDLRAVQILLGHSNIEKTVRYLGVDVEDALVLAKH